MKQILLLVHDDAGQEARLQAALDMARALGGHLACLDVVQMPAIAGDSLYGYAGAMLLADEQSREESHRDRIDARLAGEGVSWTMTGAVGGIAGAIRDAADLADIVVVNRSMDAAGAPDMRMVIGALLTKGRTPVVAVPQDGHGMNVSGTAMVAWDGSSTSAAALRAAIPLLRRAETVLIVSVDDGALRIPARDAATYLSRHGIHPIIRPERAFGRSTGDVLLTEVRERHADYVVMGGYGHNRILEALFGGVTRQFLAECPVPMVLAHD